MTVTKPIQLKQPHLPWLVGTLALLFYGVTLCHSISLNNLTLTVQVTGWTGEPTVGHPLLWLVTAPLKLLPDGRVPLALNLQSALLASLVLTVLARSVQLLPLNRLRVQAMFGRNSLGIFIRQDAWLPVVLAVAGCGLEARFWQEAVANSGEMLDVLLLAVPVWCLLEYRFGGGRRWLDAATLIWGLGLAENWALQLLLPVYIVTLFWIRGRAVTNLIQWCRFAVRMAILGAVGSSLVLLLPLVNSLLPGAPWTLKHALWESGSDLGSSWQFVRWLLRSSHSEYGIMLVTYYLAPVLPILMRLQNEGSFQISVQARIQLLVIQAWYLFSLLTCLWLTLHPILGPQNILAQHLNVNQSMLSFVYLTALGIGYLASHFLLIWGADIQAMQKRNPQFRRPVFVPQWLQYALKPAFYVLPAVMLVMLFTHNQGPIRDLNRIPLVQFGQLASASLPTGGGIVLGDDPERLHVLQAALAQRTDYHQWVVVDTTRLTEARYRARLERQQPLGWPVLSPEPARAMQTTAQFLSQLTATRPVYYLHPSFGVYFEFLDAEPHGLVYKISPASGAPTTRPGPTAALIKENEQFWNQPWATDLPAIQKNITPADQVSPRPRHHRLGFSTPEAEQSRVLGQWYSIALDSWAVHLQYADQWLPARHRLEQALALNPNNSGALLTLTGNSNQLAGATPNLTITDDLAAEFQGNVNVIKSMLSSSGLIDEPAMDFALGQFFSRLGMVRQSIRYTERAADLAPHSTPPRIFLAGLYTRARFNDQAADLLRQMRQQCATGTLAGFDQTGLDLLEASIWLGTTNQARADSILQTIVHQHPEDATLLDAVVDGYSAAGQLTNALQLVSGRLLKIPDDLRLLTSQAALQQKMGRYAEAVQTLDHVLTLTNLPSLQLERAGDRVVTGDLAGAASDYQHLREVMADSWRPDFGLALVAMARHDSVQAVSQFQIALAKSPAHSTAHDLIMEQIRQLGNGHPK